MMLTDPKAARKHLDVFVMATRVWVLSVQIRMFELCVVSVAKFTA